MENNPFHGLMSLTEASDIWNKEQSVLRRAILTGRLIEGREAKKFGKQWIVTYAGMERIYGIPDSNKKSTPASKG